MKSREPLIRAKKFQIDDARRRLAQIDAMIADFERMAVDLDRDIATEEGRSGIADPNHFAYPPLATAARGRRDNLRRSVEDLAAQREAASAVLAEAEAELALAEAAGDLDRTVKPEMGGRRGTWRHADSSRA
ncbi:flagellar export protein FliJ [Xanthobacter sp. V0B-10]|uniref:flagellar export protein FliJ n=1 Tax=Xanthobacter TaxID=279 RepID=UPI00372C159F